MIGAVRVFLGFTSFFVRPNSVFNLILLHVTRSWYGLLGFTEFELILSGFIRVILVSLDLIELGRFI